jgi:lipopolysaccharide transport system permease protein
MSVPGHTSPFAELARKRDLWWQFTVRTVELRHRGSYLGILWAGLTPLLMLGLYYVVFGKIFNGSFGVLPDETRTDYALAFFLGLILHQLTAETLSIAPGIILANPNLVKKVVFPLEILPIAQLGATWFNLVISLTLMILGAMFLGRGVAVEGLLWLPVILFPLLLLTAGICWLFAALGVFFRDLGQIMPFFAQIVLYASAVVYPIAKIPEDLWVILKWNPLLHSVELARDAIVWDTPLNLNHLGYTYIAGIAVFFLGRWAFQRLQSAFADVI